MFKFIQRNSQKLFLVLKVKYHFFETSFVYHVLNYISKFRDIDTKAEILTADSIKPKSDTIFIMGSGYSINEISEGSWKHIENTGEILSFNNFFKGKFVPIDYHIVREIESFYSIINSKSITKKYVDEIFSNPFYQNTQFFILNDKKSLASTWVTFIFKIFKDRKICLYKNLDDRLLIQPPSKDINQIPHCGATLFDAINIAYILGYKKIVLVGVDLYDRRYFWLGEDETRQSDKVRGSSHKEVHNTANLVIEVMDLWNQYLNRVGIKTYIYNERSLLSKILPVYDEKINSEY